MISFQNILNTNELIVVISFNNDHEIVILLIMDNEKGCSQQTRNETNILIRYNNFKDSSFELNKKKDR